MQKMIEPEGSRTVSWRLTLILASLATFAPFATDMYLASFPLLAEEFKTDVGAVQLSLSVFFFGLAVGQLAYGPLIDRFGRRGPLLIGIALFAVASLALAFAPGIDSFIILRLIQALGGCAGMIVSRTIVADLFPEREAARFLSLIMLVQGLAPIMAPILGGYILTYANWHAIFLFLVVFGLACLAGVYWGLPETLPPHERKAESLPRILATWKGLITERRYIVPALTGSFVFAALFAFISGSPFVYIQLFHVSEQNYGWLFGLNAFGLILAAQINRMLLKRFTSQTVLTASLTVMLIAAVCLFAASTTSSLPLLIALLFVCLANVPLIAANTVALAMEASGTHRGSGSAIIGVLQFGVASIVSAGVGLIHDTTARPMTGAILLAVTTAGLIWYFGSKKSP